MFVFKLFKCKKCNAAKQQTTQLIKAVNKLRTEYGDYNEVEYNREQDLVSDTLQSITEVLRDIENKIKPQRLQFVTNAEFIKEIETENQALKAENAELKQERVETSKTNIVNESSGETFKNLAVSLIKFRDQLLYFKDEFEEAQIPQAVKLLNNLYKETGRFMGLNKVEALEDGGTFDIALHIITSTKPTDDPSLNDTIAETFRPGYRIDGELYRQQEIIIYKSSSNAD